jgi:hypothetical protein
MGERRGARPPCAATPATPDARWFEANIAGSSALKPRSGEAAPAARPSIHRRRGRPSADRRAIRPSPARAVPKAKAALSPPTLLGKGQRRDRRHRLFFRVADRTANPAGPRPESSAKDDLSTAARGEEVRRWCRGAQWRSRPCASAARASAKRATIPPQADRTAMIVDEDGNLRHHRGQAQRRRSPAFPGLMQSERLVEDRPGRVAHRRAPVTPLRHAIPPPPPEGAPPLCGCSICDPAGPRAAAAPGRRCAPAAARISRAHRGWGSIRRHYPDPSPASAAERGTQLVHFATPSLRPRSSARLPPAPSRPRTRTPTRRCICADASRRAMYHATTARLSTKRDDDAGSLDHRGKGYAGLTERDVDRGPIAWRSGPVASQ